MPGKRIAPLRSKAERERHIFRLFARAVPLAIKPNSVRSGRGDRAPDILCRLSTDERVAFELAQIIDEDFAKGFSDTLRLKVALDETLAGSPAPFRDAFAQMFSNSLIGLFFGNHLTLQRRRAALKPLLEYIGTLGPNAVGEFFPSQPPLRDVVRMVTVFRGAFTGPVLEPVGGGFIGNPILAVLEGKFRKVYPTCLPIELVAYYDLQLEPPLSIWEPEVSRYAPEALPKSQFRRAWVFSVASGQILYVHPSLP
ncbi:MAG: hypothetical protein RDU83_13945 [bacterium]|nr:hypothetical protein [bacterium]